MKSTDYTWARHVFGSALKPSAPLTVDEWADANRVLTAKSSAEAGRWRTDRTPYWREPMRCLSEDHPAQRVVMMVASQMGKTEVGVNWLGYVMDHIRTPKPMQIVVPTDKLLARWVAQRRNPLITSTASLREKIDVTKSRDGKNRVDMLDYPGGILFLVPAGSGTNLLSDSIRFALLDEVDAFEIIAGRGDPIGMIESRQNTFLRRKMLIVSTPTIKGASIIADEYEQSDQRHYHVPCQHCGEYQVLEWEHVQWDHEAARVWYVCRHNGCMISERDKPDMLAAGQWRPENPQSKVRGYHINSLYAPIGLGYGFEDLVRQWLKSANDPDRQRQFTNERLALPYEDAKRAVRSDGLIQRAEDYRLRTAPSGCLLITAGVDTQDDRLALQVVGWGRKRRWWVLDWIELQGDPANDEVWMRLVERLSEPFTNNYGQSIRLSGVAIDMGGHRTNDVKRFVAGPLAKRLRCTVIAVFGDNNKQHTIISRPKRTDMTVSGRVLRNGFRYHRVGTEKAKDWLYNDIRHDDDRSMEDRHAHFSTDLDQNYYEQLTAEIWDGKKNRYVKKRGRRNEALDTWCYALTAANHPNVDLPSKLDAHWAKLEARYESIQVEATKPTEEASRKETTQPAAQEKPRRAQKTRRLREPLIR